MEVIYSALKDGEYLIFVGILVIAIVINLPKIFDFLSVNRKRRMDDLMDLLSNKVVEEKIKLHIRDEIQVESIRLSHGVRLGEPMLSAIFTIKERVSTEVSFRHVLRVAKLSPDVEGLDSVSYRVKLSWHDKIQTGLNLILGCLLMLFGVAGLLVFLLLLSSGFSAELLGVALLALPVGAYILSEGASLVSVRHINAALNKYEKRRGHSRKTTMKVV